MRADRAGRMKPWCEGRAPVRRDRRAVFPAVRTALLSASVLVLLCCLAFAKEGVIQCANLVYAGTQTSKCFSDEFLRLAEEKSTLRTERRFKRVKLADEELYGFPFAIMTGESAFTLGQAERDNLKAYLENGGFLLASAGCSSKEWDASFRRELARIFPDKPLRKLPMDHALFKTVFEVKGLELSHGGRAQLEGLEIDGKIVAIYSAEGLNDTAHMSGCCCCGGNEIQNSVQVNVNILAYALLH